MSTDLLARAKEARKNYRWTQRLITKVHSDARSNYQQQREIVANLFVGEWTKYLEDVGEEVHIRFRGGEGYVPREDIGNKRVLEIYFIDVGQGDSIIIQTADDKRVLIDGGMDKSAHSFLQWKYNLKKYHIVFDAVIMTHGDADHAGGLISILKDNHVLVKAIYHNGITKRQDNSLGEIASSQEGDVLVDLYDDIEDLKPQYSELKPLYQEWVDAVTKAKRRAERHKLDFKCVRADQNTERISIGGEEGLQIRFLGPINLGDEKSPRLKKFGDRWFVGKTLNGNSVSVLLEYGQARILLCGDMNEPAEKFFLRHWGEKSTREKALQAHVFKANHHGSKDFSSSFLSAVKPWVTVVSSGDFPDYGHPRACLLGSLGHYAPQEIDKPLLFSTEIAATFVPIPESQLGETGRHVYEKNIHGMIHVRTDGNWLAAGRVYGRTQKKRRRGRLRRSIWKWEAYAFNLANGRPLGNELLAA